MYKRQDKVTINWYVDLAGWSNNSSSLISKEIYRRTGVNIVFETPANADGSKLSTMMQTNTFTDVISIAANTQERIKLAEAKNYIYPIQELAKRWAPTLLTRLDEEMAEMYAASDGNLYGIPNHFYSTVQVNEYKDCLLYTSHSFDRLSDFRFSASRTGIRHGLYGDAGFRV